MFKKNNNFLFQPYQPTPPVHQQPHQGEINLMQTSKQRNRHQQDTYKYHTLTPKNHPPNQQPTSDQMQLQTEDYLNLQIVMGKQVQVLKDSILLCRQKNHLKDRQTQHLISNIETLGKKIQVMQQKLAYKQSRMSKISIKCQQLGSQTGGQQQQLKRESVVLKEELQKCCLLNKDILSMQKKVQSSWRQVQFYKKKLEAFKQAQLENASLAQYLIKLEQEDKQIEEEDNYQKNECIDLFEKLKSLRVVYHERSKINSRNLAKLHHIQTEVANITRAKDAFSKKGNEIKGFEMQIGDLNQQLLLMNEEISQLDFKIRKKEKTIKELRGKLIEKKHQKSYLTYNAIEENQTPKESYRVVQSSEEEPFEKIVTRSIKTSKHHSNSPTHSLSHNNTNNNSPFVIKTLITPTFTPHQHQEVDSREKQVSEQQNGEALKNIQKLISRFEQIKTKQKYKN